MQPLLAQILAKESIDTQANHQLHTQETTYLVLISGRVSRVLGLGHPVNIGLML